MRAVNKLKWALPIYLVLLDDALHILLGCINDGPDLGTSRHISHRVTDADGHAVLQQQGQTERRHKHEQSAPQAPLCLRTGRLTEPCSAETSA